MRRLKGGETEEIEFLKKQNPSLHITPRLGQLWMQNEGYMPSQFHVENGILQQVVTVLFENRQKLKEMTNNYKYEFGGYFTKNDAKLYIVNKGNENTMTLENSVIYPTNADRVSFHTHPIYNRKQFEDPTVWRRDTPIWLPSPIDINTLLEGTFFYGVGVQDVIFSYPYAVIISTEDFNANFYNRLSDSQKKEHVQDIMDVLTTEVYSYLFGTLNSHIDPNKMFVKEMRRNFDTLFVSIININEPAFLDLLDY